MIGHFINILPVRLDGSLVAADPLNAACAAQRSLLDTLAHGSVSFLDGVPEDMASLPNPVLHPWFNDHIDFPPMSFGGYPAEPVNVPTSFVQIHFGLVTSRRHGGEYQFEINYPVRLMNEANARDLLAEYLTLLRTLLNRADYPLAG